MIFKVQQYQVKREIKQRIKKDVPTEELTAIVLTQQNSNEFDWEHEREFRYKGVMYDVVKKEIVNKTTTLLFCVTDKQETILFAKLNEEANKNMESKNNGNNPLKNVFKLLSNIYLPVNKTLQYLEKNNIKAEFTTFSFYYKIPFIAISNPPPELV